MLKSLHIYIKIFLHYIFIYMKVKVKVAQSCLTLCNPMEYTVHGILQARILEWVALPFSRGSSQPRDQTQVSHISGVFLTSWAIREDHTYIYVYVWWFYIYIYTHIYMIWFLNYLTDRTPVSPSWLLSNTQGVNCPKRGLCSVLTL